MYILMFQTILGHGVDCHLLGLRELAAELGLPTPDIFTDPTYLKSNHFTLSTSQVSRYIYPGPVVIKLFSYSTQLSTKFIMLINVKMPTIVGILTFISMINTTSERLQARHFFICQYFSFYEQLKFRAQLS